MSRKDQKYLGNNIEITQTLVADLADAATLDFSYPTGFSENSFVLGNRHMLTMNGTELFAPDDFTIAFGASNITITNRTGTTFETGAVAVLQVDVDGNLISVFDNAETGQQIPLSVCPMQLMKIDIGQPATADVDAIVDAVTAGADGVLAIETNTAELTFTMDTPVGRNITAVSAAAGDNTTFSVRVVGLDTDCNPQTEDRAMNGVTPVVGVKAFSSIESVTFIDAAGDPVVSAGAIDVGFGDIFGLPLRLNNETHQIEREFIDDTIVATGTFVAGSAVPPTNVSPDVRGTFLPATVADGSNTYTIYMWMADVNDGGFYKPEDRSRHNSGAGAA